MTTSSSFSDVRGTTAMPFKSMQECRVAQARIEQMFAFDGFRINARCVVTDAFERRGAKK